MDTCKKTLEISIPAEEVAGETERVVASLQKKVRLPGFRPGKAPLSMLRKRFADDIRQDLLSNLIPKHLWKQAEAEGLNVVGRPDISDVHLHEGEPLRFKAEFEIAPEIELKEYKGLTVAYQDPEVSDDDVQQRLEALREQKAEYSNVDPRPLAGGDFAVVALESLAGVEGQPIKQDELMLEVGGADTLAGFSENLSGMSPGEEKEFDVVYPEDYGQPRLSGKTVRFRAAVKGIRRKDLPELNDEFARDLGDYQTIEEVRDAVRKSILLERQYTARQEAEQKLVETLVDAHEFPVPEAYIDRQIESQVERHLRTLAVEGVDPRSIKIDWEKLKTSQRDKAIREVKGSLLLARIADAEAIHATNEEVDREIARIARQQREPAAATRKRLEKEGLLGQIAARLRTDKVLSFLFEQARKVAGGQ